MNNENNLLGLISEEVINHPFEHDYDNYGVITEKLDSYYEKKKAEFIRGAEAEIEMENHIAGVDNMVLVPKEELKGLFKASEGSIELIYGRIRNGKSTHAVRLMYQSLIQGRVVYSNLLLDLSSVTLDERDSFSQLFYKLLFFKKRFYNFNKKNYHWFNPTTGECDGVQVFDPNKKGDEIKWLNSLTDCEIFYDEGQWLLDSYEMTNVSVEKRKLITETGHNNRKIYIIAQRTQSVHVNARGNVNIFWKCKKNRFLFWSTLTVYEFQDMKGQDVDEDAEPVSIQNYWGNNMYWKLFNTHYLRAGKPSSQEIYFDAYDLTSKEKLHQIWSKFGEPLLKQGFAFGNFLQKKVIHFIHRVAFFKNK